jgi:hypothetical protein
MRARATTLIFNCKVRRAGFRNPAGRTEEADERNGRHLRADEYLSRKPPGESPRGSQQKRQGPLSGANRHHVG